MVTRVPVQVRVLGSIEVTRDGQAIRLAGQGQRAVLGTLALEQGRPVSVERLAEAIWQFNPPATSRTKIQAHVCALRRALGQPARGGCGPLLTTGSGYALCGECVQLDLAEFDRLTAKGRRALAAGEPGQAAELFADALALWRGPAFADAVSPALRLSICTPSKPAFLNSIRTLLSVRAVAFAVGFALSVCVTLPTPLVLDSTMPRFCPTASL